MHITHQLMYGRISHSIHQYVFSQRHHNHHYGFNGNFQITIAPTFPYIATQRKTCTTYNFTISMKQNLIHQVTLNESIIEIGDRIRSVLGWYG